MAKITDSVYVTLTTPASNDIVPVVDVSDTTMSPAGTTKQTTVAGLTAGVTLPLTALGDTLYENATPAPAKLAGNTTTTKKFLTQTGTGSVSAAPGWNTIVAGDLPTGAASLLGVFGSGSDGSVTFDGTTPVLGLTPSAGVYTLNRDVQATSITVGGASTATTIKTGNFRIFCQGTVTIASNGTVSNAGNPASGSTAGAKTGGGSTVLVAGNNGGAGGTGVSGTGGAGGNASWGAAGSSGGAGVSGAAGAGGTITPSALTTTVATNNVWITPGPGLSCVTAYNGSTVQMGGAAGAGGGGSDASSNAGGGGGGGGGMVIIFAWAISNAGSITAAGGNGAAGAAGSAGGGGGGNGGFILTYTLSGMTGAGTTTVTGGTGGAHGGSGGTAGSNGSNGAAVNVMLA